MKKTTPVFRFSALHFCIASLFLITTNASAFNYIITFTGSSASTTVDSVIVQNVTKGTTVTVPAGNTLSLTDQRTAVDQLNADNESVSIYPVPIQSTATLTFTAANEGNTQITAYALDGKKVLGFTSSLHKGKNTFKLTLPAGVYTLQVQGNGYQYNAKAISQATKYIKPNITFADITTESKPQKAKASGTTTMAYSIGDQLLYKGKSSIYTTVVTDQPASTKTTNFNFVACTDADGNNYSAVTIGTQTWMVENLVTTKYKDGTQITNITGNPAWENCVNTSSPAYCWYNNDIVNKVFCGGLYNWYAVKTGKLAPTGWHVPTDAEWTTLENYLIANGYNFDGSTSVNLIAKSLASQTGWAAYYSMGTGFIGNIPSANNKSGFTALAGGARYYDGYFDDDGNYGRWWSASERSLGYAWFWTLGFSLKNSSLIDTSNEQCGFTVRCLRD